MLGKGRLQASNKEISGITPEIFLTVYGLVECNQETGFVSVQWALLSKTTFLFEKGRVALHKIRF